MRVCGLLSLCNQTLEKIDLISGWGVFALDNVAQGEFVLEYVGEHITEEEARRREKKGNCYLYGFKYNGKFHW